MWLSLQGERIAVTFRRNGEIIMMTSGERIATYYESEQGYMVLGNKILVHASTKEKAMLLWADVINGDKEQCGLCKRVGEGMRYSKALGWNLCRECDQPGVLLKKRW